MRIFMVDNYDSFTYNVVHILASFEGVSVTVRRNDQFTFDEVEQSDKIVLSPGPGIPMEAGLMPDLVREFSGRRSILGICLGHQCIGEVFGGTLRNLGRPVHGKATPFQRTAPDDALFRGLPESFSIGRYHSWVVDRKDLPDSLEVTAVDGAGEIMALRHREYDVRGVQFHPESILTEHGRTILENWVRHEEAA